jgi:AbrB family looped-hinge helix DNA binding protein
MTSKGQVTIPKALRQQLGLGRGSRVCFALVGDHIELRPWKPQQSLPASGFGLLKSQRQAARRLIDFADALHHASCRSCEAIASFNDRGFARSIRQLNLPPRVVIPTPLP